MKFWLRLDRRWERRQVGPEAETPEQETTVWRGEKGGGLQIDINNVGFMSPAFWTNGKYFKIKVIVEMKRYVSKNKYFVP